MSRTLGLRTGLHRQRTPQRVIEILEANAPCRMTIDQILLELEERFDTTTSAATVTRAIHRLSDDGRIVKELETYLDYEAKPAETHDSAWARENRFGSTLGYVAVQRIVVGAA